jgi:hypothetical protein
LGHIVFSIEFRLSPEIFSFFDSKEEVQKLTRGRKNNMELGEFIEKTIVQTISAIEGASKKTGRKVTLLPTGSKNLREIEFDIAVSVKKKGTKGGSGSVNVLSFFNAKGGGKSETKNSTISRVKFGVNIGNRTK